MQAGVPEGRALGLRLERANRDGARTLVSDMFERGDALALFHAPGSHFNRVRGFGLESPVSAADLAAIEAFYAAHLPGSHQFELTDWTHPSAAEVLRAAGYKPTVTLAVLVREVEHPLDGIPWSEHPLPPGIVVRQVDRTDEAALERNARVSYAGFHPERPEITPVYLDALLRAIRRPTADVYDGYVDGELVGASTADVYQGVTWFYGASTLPHAQRRGLQRAFMLARLAGARARGSDVVAVAGEETSPTIRNARRLGFRDSHQRLGWTKG